MSELEKLRLHVYERIAQQARILRGAQKDYMKKRGDDALGKRVEEYALKLDELLECLYMLTEDYQ